jgi:hypothetical protein
LALARSPQKAQHPQQAQHRLRKQPFLPRLIRNKPQHYRQEPQHRGRRNVADLKDPLHIRFPDPQHYLFEKMGMLRMLRMLCLPRLGEGDIAARRR